MFRIIPILSCEMLKHDYRDYTFYANAQTTASHSSFHFTSLCLVSIFSKVITHFPFKKECRRTTEESTEAE